jgi:protein-tyrosine phosphatase
MKRIAKAKFNPGKAELLLNEIYPGENRSVMDPWYGEEPGYHQVYKMIDEACDAILRKYAPTSTTSQTK